MSTAAQADPITINYSTSIVISDIGATVGSPGISIQNLTDATVTTQATTAFGTTLNPAPGGVGTVLPLGYLEPTAIPALGGYPTTPTTYDNTPFTVTVTINSVNGNTQAASPASFTAQGFLNGTYSPTGTSNVAATFLGTIGLDPRFPQGLFGSFSSGGYDVFLAIAPGSQGAGSPSGLFSSGPLAADVVVEFATPEPTSLIVAATLGLAHLGLARLRRRGLPG